MPKIESIILRSRNPKDQRRFYCDVLGMTDFGNGSIGYNNEQAMLIFQKTNDCYLPKPNDLYWKIALAVPNIELAYQQLSDQGIQIGKPHQFQDIGYLAHFTDPEGFAIELIEHWFQGHRKPETIEPDTLGGGAHLNLLTLRTTNINNIIEKCKDWGMKLLSIQPVKSHGFTLYFFAFTLENPPSLDLYALENREWLYQRKYTVLEIQHVHSESTIRQSVAGEAGYAGAVFINSLGNIQCKELLINTFVQN